MSKRKPPAAPPKFKVGDKVRVKHGVNDVDYPDMPMGGWAGTVIEVIGGDTFAIRWSDETLAAIHPVFKKRCEKDGVEAEEYSLTGDDLESDLGGLLDIEPPTHIETKPLSPKDQDDRIRMIFGLTSNDPLPEVDDKSLLAYHKHLATTLTFPIKAEHGAEYGHPERIKIIGMGDPDEEPMIDEEHGILCEARVEGQVVAVALAEVEITKGKTNRQLIKDYCSWFWDNG